MSRTLIFLILAFVMCSFAFLCGDILNNLFIGAETKLFHYRNVDYTFLQNIPIKQIHLSLLNIFFSVLFAIFLTLSILMSGKESKK